MSVFDSVLPEMIFKPFFSTVGTKRISHWNMSIVSMTTYEQEIDFRKKYVHRILNNYQITPTNFSTIFPYRISYTNRIHQKVSKHQRCTSFSEAKYQLINIYWSVFEYYENKGYILEDFQFKKSNIKLNFDYLDSSKSK